MGKLNLERLDSRWPSRAIEQCPFALRQNNICIINKNRRKEKREKSTSSSQTDAMCVWLSGTHTSFGSLGWRREKEEEEEEKIPKKHHKSFSAESVENCKLRRGAISLPHLPIQSARRNGLQLVQEAETQRPKSTHGSPLRPFFPLITCFMWSQISVFITADYRVKSVLWIWCSHSVGCDHKMFKGAYYHTAAVADPFRVWKIIISMFA